MMQSIMRCYGRRTATLAGALLFVCSGTVMADQWNERTTLTFSEPVMVPGATLQRGSYEFRLADSSSARHIVQIRRQDGELVTTTQAMPTKRSEPKGDVVLKFNPAGRPRPRSRRDEALIPISPP
jgi:hypothetical protein